MFPARAPTLTPPSSHWSPHSHSPLLFALRCRQLVVRGCLSLQLCHLKAGVLPSEGEWVTQGSDWELAVLYPSLVQCRECLALNKDSASTVTAGRALAWLARGSPGNTSPFGQECGTWSGDQKQNPHRKHHGPACSQPCLLLQLRPEPHLEPALHRNAAAPLLCVVLHSPEHPTASYSPGHLTAYIIPQPTASHRSQHPTASDIPQYSTASHSI